jgi:hypothetical protein
MTEDVCIHGLERQTCSICGKPAVPKASQATLNVVAIQEAVRELSPDGDFRTKDVANHEAVRQAHRVACEDPRFDQQIGPISPTR